MKKSKKPNITPDPTIKPDDSVMEVKLTGESPSTTTGTPSAPFSVVVVEDSTAEAPKLEVTPGVIGSIPETRFTGNSASDLAFLEDTLTAEAPEGKTMGIGQLIDSSPGTKLAEFNETMEQPTGFIPSGVSIHPFTSAVMFADDLATMIENAGNHDVTPDFVAALKAQAALYREARGI